MNILDGVDKNRVVNGTLFAQAAFALAFFISACVVARNSNAGFNVVITAIVYFFHIAYVGFVVGRGTGLYQIFGNLRNDLVETDLSMRMIGAGSAIGTSLSLSIWSLMTAIYWGEMSGCESGYNDVQGYSCYSPSGMRSVSFFASFLFMSEILLAYLIMQWKEDIFPDNLDNEYEGLDNARGLPPRAFDVSNGSIGVGSHPENHAVDL